MRARSIVALTAIAVVLGVASWYVADPSPGMSGLASAWFFWLPGWVHYLVWPESALGLMAITTSVYTLQYLVVFALLAALVRATHLIRDFVPRRDGVGRAVDGAAQDH